jgi:hypothetical protein
MKQFLILTLLLAHSVVSFAQLEQAIEGSFFPWESSEENKKATCYTVVSDANVRDKANASATVIAKLPIGTAVTIEQVTSDTLLLNGFKAPWCKVSFTNNGKSQNGYLWGGTLAFVAYSIENEYEDSRNGTQYLIGISKVEKEKWTLQARVAQRGVELAKTEFQSPGDLGYYVRMNIHGSQGLKGIEEVVEIETYYPACGYPQTNHLLMVSEKKKINKILETSSMSDGGVFYSKEDYVLPYDKGGIQDHILVINSSAEFMDNGTDLVMEKQQYSIKVHKWNGEKLQKIKELK